MSNKPIPNQTKSKPKLTLSAQPHIMRISPNISRIRAAVHTAKTSEEIGGKVSTPKPRSRHLNSPFVQSPSKLSFSKLTPLRMASTHRISARSSGNSKNFALGETLPACLRTVRMPAPLDFAFFIRHLLDHFHSAEAAAEYFFICRGRELDFEQFSSSCRALALDKVFMDLESIYEEGRSGGCLTKNSFVSKIVSVQNSELKENLPSHRARFSDVVKKLMNKTEIDGTKKAKRILEAIRLAKGSDDLIARLQVENSKVRLTSKELNVLLEQRGPQPRKKRDLNLTMRLNCSPYSLMPGGVMTTKKNL